MLVQVGTFGVGSQRLPLRAVGRQKKDLAVATLNIGREQSRNTPAQDRTAQDQVAIGEEELCTVSGEVEVAYAVALGRIEACIHDGARDFQGRRRREKLNTANE